MIFGEPFGGIIVGARGAVLSVLLRTGAPLTGRRVHALTEGRHSLGAVQQALRDLERLGLITANTVGRARVHQINSAHEAIAPLRSMVSPFDMLRRVIGDTVSDAQAVIVFGSIARGEADADSDIDLLVIAGLDWQGRVDLAQAIQQRLGNNCDVLHMTPEDFLRSPSDREPLVAEVLRDGVALVGEIPRRSRRQAS